MSDEEIVKQDSGISHEAKVEAIEELQQAICALVEDDLSAFGERVGYASKAVNESAGVPYHLMNAGGPDVEEYGPAVALPGGHAAWVTLPEGYERDGTTPDFSVNFDDHLHVHVTGKRKDTPMFEIEGDEFDVNLVLDRDAVAETERSSGGGAR